MNKTQLAEAVAERLGTSATDARKQVDAVLESIVDGVAAGERVSLIGFGTFSPAARPARSARNPQTGNTVEVPAAVVPRFRVGAGFKARVTEAAPEPAVAAATGGTPSTTVAAAAKSAAKAPAKKKDAPKVAAKDDKPSKKDSKKDSKKKSGKKGKKGKKK